MSKNIFFMHNIEMPMSKTIDNYKKICISHSVDYYKQRKNYLLAKLGFALEKNKNKKKFINMVVISMC